MTKALRNHEELERENTELKQVVEKLRQANEMLLNRVQESSADLDLANEQMMQLAAIVESSEDAIVGCTMGGFITIWNRGAERLFGYSAEEVIGQGTSTNARLHWPDELRAIKRSGVASMSRLLRPCGGGRMARKSMFR
jgi:PAS domain-containing protein